MNLQLSFVPPNHEMLRQKAAEVPLEKLKDPQVQRAIDGMLEIARGERADLGKRILVGLAAPQVGIPLKIILVDLGVTEARDKLGDLHIYINPRITWQSEEKELNREGCFSTGNIFGTIHRAVKIKISAWDREGSPIEEEHQGFTARVFQHEIDHLDGIRFPDRRDDIGNLYHVEKEEVPSFHRNWRDWKKSCTFLDWEKIRQ